MVKCSHQKAHKKFGKDRQHWTRDIKILPNRTLLYRPSNSVLRAPFWCRLFFSMCPWIIQMDGSMYHYNVNGCHPICVLPLKNPEIHIWFNFLSIYSIPVHCESWLCIFFRLGGLFAMGRTMQHATRNFNTEFECNEVKFHAILFFFLFFFWGGDIPEALYHSNMDSLDPSLNRSLSFHACPPCKLKGDKSQVKPSKAINT